MEPSHWPQVQRIYQEGIDTGIATFENSAPEWDQWDTKFLSSCRLVGIFGDSVVGWSALQPVSPREAYRGVAEVTVYVDARYQRRGFGKALLQRLIEESESEGFWMLTASIFEANTLSIHLHESLGFHVVGPRERIGKKNGEWVTTVLMDRRSSINGID